MIEDINYEIFKMTRVCFQISCLMQQNFHLNVNIYNWVVRGSLR